MWQEYRQGIKTSTENCNRLFSSGFPVFSRIKKLMVAPVLASFSQRLSLLSRRKPVVCFYVQNHYGSVTS